MQDWCSSIVRQNGDPCKYSKQSIYSYLVAPVTFTTACGGIIVASIWCSALDQSHKMIGVRANCLLDGCGS
eukprot:4281803-Amphidinium_carterae.1